MGQSLAQIYLHTIFSTKERRPFLNDAGLRERHYAYMAGICRNLDSPAIIVGGVEDHVHNCAGWGSRHVFPTSCAR